MEYFLRKMLHFLREKALKTWGISYAFLIYVNYFLSCLLFIMHKIKKYLR